MSDDASEPGELGPFRREVRDWLEAERPPAPGFKLPQTFLEVESDAQLEYLRDWQRKVYDAGYLGFDVPEEYGGRGVDPARHRVVAQELVRARAPFFLNFIGLNWAGPVILAFGSEAQKRRFLPPLLRADELWCQGFSEPGAGSDLASLTTRASRSERGWQVDGHKVWTTLAHAASFMILLARTDPSVNKYAGLTFFLMPMTVPGVTVQPLVKLSGEGGFNQVLFDAAVAPPDAVLGAEGQGWEVAMATLLFERGAAEGSARERTASLLEQLERLLQLARATLRDGRPASEDPRLRDRIAELYIQAHAMGHSAARSAVAGLVAERPMALPLMSKLVASEWNQRLAELACEILGEDAALSLDDPHAPFAGEWPRAFMNSFGMTIGGGTSEILRNILGERVLGLPKSK
ncbi:MAG: acyl-CoA dehydrogenase family protein [Sorangiineae bacterium]|nr:acyl-CoA dehydrogenase family protein [Polyangiaceae bacterium]MEB2322819.1 acyl-CoA dehydrogenase family protein [Sorangiineae bacterium]